MQDICRILHTFCIFTAYQAAGLHIAPGPGYGCRVPDPRDDSPDRGEDAETSTEEAPTPPETPRTDAAGHRTVDRSDAATGPRRRWG